MKSTHTVDRFDYSKIESKDDIQYWGIHPKKGRLHIDTKRYKITCEEAGITEYLPDGLFKNRTTPYFIPEHIKRHDYKVNIFKDLINELKKGFISFIKS